MLFNIIYREDYSRAILHVYRYLTLLLVFTSTHLLIDLFRLCLILAKMIKMFVHLFRGILIENSIPGQGCTELDIVIAELAITENNNERTNDIH